VEPHGSRHRRLLLLITDLEIGGTPTVVRELAIRLREASAGAHVEVACLSGMGPVGDQLLQAKIPVTALNAQGPTDLRVLPKLIRLVRHRRFDVVFSFLVHANAIAAAAKPFCGGQVRWLQSIQTTQPNPRWHWWVQRAAQYAAERIVVPSKSVAEVAVEWADVPWEKIAVIPNAIDVSQFNPLIDMPAAHAHVGKASPFPVGFVGRLDPVKRVPDLLGAVSLLGNAVHLHIFGDGEQRRVIEGRIRELNIGSNVTLHGTIDRPQTAMRQVGLLVLPSEAEGFGLVLIEAMAAGVPVVATNVPGIREVIRDGQTGMLVPVASPNALANAIRRLVGDPSLRARLVRNGLQEVRERFSWQRIIQKYVELLDV